MYISLYNRHDGFILLDLHHYFFFSRSMASQSDSIVFHINFRKPIWVMMSDYSPRHRFYYKKRIYISISLALCFDSVLFLLKQSLDSSPEDFCWLPEPVATFAEEFPELRFFEPDLTVLFCKTETELASAPVSLVFTVRVRRGLLAVLCCLAMSFL